METINDFIGSYYKVMPEGYFVTGRHNGCWLDIGSDSTTGASGGPMSTAGLLEITNHAKTLKATYAKSLV